MLQYDACSRPLWATLSVILECDGIGMISMGYEFKGAAREFERARENLEV